MPDVCYVDGRIVAEAEATIPVLDRGFLFADSVYEVLRTRGGVPFAWEVHLQRLRASAEGMALDLGRSDRELMGAMSDTLSAARAGATASEHGEYIRLIVTRGDTAAIGLDPENACGAPRLVILVRPLVAARGGQPATVALVPRDARDAVTRGAGRRDPSIKSGSYLSNMLSLAEAHRRGASECVFVEADGQISEASTANAFAVFDGTIVTPPQSAGLLAGVTRRLVFAAAARAGIPIEERSISAERFRSADEAFLTGTLRDLAPVYRIDDRPLRDTPADGAHHGPVTERLASAWREEIREQSARDAERLDALLASPLRSSRGLRRPRGAPAHASSSTIALMRSRASW